jgi:hypothetical protein
MPNHGTKTIKKYPIMKNFTRVLFLMLSLAPITKLCAKGSHSPVTESLRTNLYLLSDDNTTVLADGNLVQYNNAFSAGVDYMDVVKLNNINETFGIMRNGVLLAVERRPIIGIADTVFFNLTNTTARNYQFQFIATELNHPGLNGTLVDSYTGIQTPINLNGTTSVNFAVDNSTASQNPARFMVVFGSSSITPVHFTSVTALQQGHNTGVSWNVQNELNIKQYQVEKSTDGINFTRVATIKSTGGNKLSSKYDWEDAATVTGTYFYRICGVDIDGALTYSQVVKIKMGMANQSVTIFPNPVHDGTVGLEFSNMPQGNYVIRIISAGGQQIIKTSFNNTTGNVSQNISFNKSINKGVYQLEVIAPDNSTKVLKMLYY